MTAAEPAYFLVIADGPGKGVRYVLNTGSAVIGRGADCDIRLDAARGISRRHAQINSADNALRVRDLGSQNGTFVNGKRVREAVISEGSKIRIGEVTFVLGVSASAPALSGGGEVTAAANGGLVGARANSLDEMESGYDESAEVSAISEEGKSGGALAKLACLVLLLLGLLYALSQLSVTYRPQLPPSRILKVRESEILGLPGGFSKYSRLGKTDDGRDIIEVVAYDGIIKKNLEEAIKRNTKNHWPVRHFFVVRGVARGDAWIVLKDSSGKVIKRFQILVRGIQAYKWPEDMSEREAAEIVEEKLRDAKRFENDGEIFHAYSSLDEARELSTKYMRDLEKAGAIRAELVSLKRQLSREVGRLFDEAITLAFPDRKGPNRPHWRQAFLKLEEAKRLVPDEDSKEWQILDFWQGEIRRILKKR